ncbi:glycosyltransferase family 9 protein [Nocardiopsis alba]|uniref:glycosyltransferase family 9 protein n=1 Tax=Nocardiopsis alba TaxID=53437 RepID=UPI0033A1FC4B
MDEEPAGAPSLLVLRCLGLGDFVTAVPALRALERSHPDHVRHLAGPAWYRELVRAAGLRWRVIPSGPLRAPPWKGRAPDLAVNLHGHGPRSTSALRSLAPRVLWTYGTPAVTGDTEAPWPGAVHDVRLWCGLLEWNGVPTRPTDLRWPSPDGHDGDGKTVLVHPGAAAPSRRWPASRFSRVVRWLSERGAKVLITGNAEERPLAERVARDAGRGPESVLAGRTTLSGLAHTVAGARLLVCGDTGIAHLASAYGTPSVRLFGPMPPSLWGPIVDIDLHACLWSGSRGDPHANRLDLGLAALDVEEVLLACQRVLARSESHRPSPGGPLSAEEG